MPNYMNLSSGIQGFTSGLTSGMEMGDRRRQRQMQQENMMLERERQRQQDERQRQQDERQARIDQINAEQLARGNKRQDWQDEDAAITQGLSRSRMLQQDEMNKKKFEVDMAASEDQKKMNALKLDEAEMNQRLNQLGDSYAALEGGNLDLALQIANKGRSPENQIKNMYIDQARDGELVRFYADNMDRTPFEIIATASPRKAKLLSTKFGAQALGLTPEELPKYEAGSALTELNNVFNLETSNTKDAKGNIIAKGISREQHNDAIQAALAGMPYGEIEKKFGLQRRANDTQVLEALTKLEQAQAQVDEAKDVWGKPNMKELQIIAEAEQKLEDAKQAYQTLESMSKEDLSKRRYSSGLQQSARGRQAEPMIEGSTAPSERLPVMGQTTQQGEGPQPQQGGLQAQAQGTHVMPDGSIMANTDMSKIGQDYTAGMNPERGLSQPIVNQQTQQADMQTGIRGQMNPMRQINVPTTDPVIRNFANDFDSNKDGRINQGDKAVVLAITALEKYDNAQTPAQQQSLAKYFGPLNLAKFRALKAAYEKQAKMQAEQQIGLTR